MDTPLARGGGLMGKGKGGPKVQPLADRVVIQPAKEGEAMRGGLYIPDTAKEKPSQGEVVAVGPGRLSEDGTRLDLDVKVGDKVLYGKYSEIGRASGRR